ncbi:hypothetical protein CHUAL_011292 [Chamberlinius hualienensis]
MKINIKFPIFLYIFLSYIFVAIYGDITITKYGVHANANVISNDHNFTCCFNPPGLDYIIKEITWNYSTSSFLSVELFDGFTVYNTGDGYCTTLAVPNPYAGTYTCIYQIIFSESIIPYTADFQDILLKDINFGDICENQYDCVTLNAKCDSVLSNNDDNVCNCNGQYDIPFSVQSLNPACLDHSEVKDTCINDNQCTKIKENIKCINSVCTCFGDLTSVAAEGNAVMCIQPKHYGEHCTYDEECQLSLKNTACLYDYGTYYSCECAEGYTYDYRYKDYRNDYENYEICYKKRLRDRFTTGVIVGISFAIIIGFAIVVGTIAVIVDKFIRPPSNNCFCATIYGDVNITKYGLEADVNKNDDNITYTCHHIPIGPDYIIKNITWKYSTSFSLSVQLFDGIGFYNTSTEYCTTLTIPNPYSGTYTCVYQIIYGDTLIPFTADFEDIFLKDIDYEGICENQYDCITLNAKCDNVSSHGDNECNCNGEYDVIFSDESLNPACLDHSEVNEVCVSDNQCTKFKENINCECAEGYTYDYRYKDYRSDYDYYEICHKKRLRDRFTTGVIVGISFAIIIGFAIVVGTIAVIVDKFIRPPSNNCFCATIYGDVTITKYGVEANVIKSDDNTTYSCTHYIVGPDYILQSITWNYSTSSSFTVQLFDGISFYNTSSEYQTSLTIENAYAGTYTCYYQIMFDDSIILTHHDFNEILLKDIDYEDVCENQYDCITLNAKCDSISVASEDNICNCNGEYDIPFTDDPLNPACLAHSEVKENCVSDLQCAKTKENIKCVNKHYGEHCTYDEECQLTLKNTACLYDYGTYYSCECAEGYTYDYRYKDYRSDYDYYEICHKKRLRDRFTTGVIVGISFAIIVGFAIVVGTIAVIVDKFIRPPSNKYSTA